MSDTLSTENLLTCLVDKEKFKGTQTYLHEAGQFNETVYTFFNEAISMILLKPNKNYMSKLLALRLFKQLVLVANFTLLDFLDEKIEETIINVTQYNKKSKQVNRGANYFIEQDKLKKDQEIQKIGTTYVLLASEILVVLAKWYPVDQDGQESRFSQMVKELKAHGVNFPDENQLNFFKKDDEQKFRNNYNKWLKWYVQKVKEEQIQQTMKQIGENKLTESKNSLEQKKQVKQESKPQLETKNQYLKVQEKPKEILCQMSAKKQNPKEQNKNANNDILKQIDEQKSRLIQSVISLNKKCEKNIIEAKKYEDQIKQKDDLIVKYEKQLLSLRTENQKFLKLYEEAENQKKKSIIQCQNFMNQLKIKDQEINNLKKNHEEIMKQCKEPSGQPISETKSHQCYKIFIRSPNSYEQLQQQIQILQIALDNAQKHFFTKKSQLQQEILTIKQHNSKISKILQQKNRELKNNEEKNINYKENKILPIDDQDQINIATEIIGLQPSASKLLCQSKNNQQSNHIKLAELTNDNGYSMSQFLKKRRYNQLQNQVPKPSNKSRSLRKTESQHCMATNKGFHTATNGGWLNKMASIHQQKLSKTSKNSSYKSFFETSSSMVTVYPYLKQYFPVLPSQVKNFKQICFNTNSKNGYFFQNQVIMAGIRKVSWCKHVFVIFNRTNVEIKLKIQSQQLNFEVQGQRSRKIKPQSGEQFDIKTINFDINLRYPTFTLTIGNQKLSLANSIHSDLIHIPFPITILDYCHWKSQQFQCNDNSKFTKYSSNKLFLSSCLKNIQECFSSFKICYNKGGMTAKAFVQLINDQNCRLYIQIQQIQHELSVTVKFKSDSMSSSNFGRVMLQVLLYLIQN